MSDIHPDNIFRQGNSERGDVRVGTCYGHRTAKSYNDLKVKVRELRTGKQCVLRYTARKLLNDDSIREFEVINGHLDPTMFVMTQCPGSVVIIPDTGCPEGVCRFEGWERWPMYEEDGRVVFVAPPGYNGGPISWVHDKKFIDQFESQVYESQKIFSFGPQT